MVKNRPKDFTKLAWASRLTAPVIKVDLVIQCRDLPKKDLLSQADSFCVLWEAPYGYTPTVVKGMPVKLPGRQEKEIGRTEIARACHDPVFVQKFRLEFSFHEEQTYIIRVYDEDLQYHTDLKEHDYLGGCVFSLGQLMGAKGCTIARKLAHEKAYMVITGTGECSFGLNRPLLSVRGVWYMTRFLGYCCSLDRMILPCFVLHSQKLRVLFGFGWFFLGIL